MTAIHETFSSGAIAFAPAPALLGADTNGAAPQRTYGYLVEGDIYSERNEAVQSWWLRAVIDPALDCQKAEYVMFAADAGQIERVLGAIATAAATPGYDKVLEGTFEGYANTAQIAFDDETNEDCIENLRCRVASALEGSFSLRLEKGGKAVATLSARMTPEGIDRTLQLAADLRAWAARNVEAIERLPAPAA
jgi:hypothetical protein